MMVRDYGISLDGALFPLLVGIERRGPIGVVDLADGVGRDYTTVSRQVAKLEGLGLITRKADAKDRRIRMAAITRSEEKTSELKSLMRISYAVLCWKKKT